MPLDDIDIVLERLTVLVDDARSRRDRAGYFAAMYRKVTIAVKDAIIAGRFEDGDRIAHLDRVFAERYLDAHVASEAGGRPTASWRVAFDADNRWRPIIIQHLLVGMNAHINLDLGIAAATVAPGADIAELKSDFNTINDVLADLIDGFMADVAEISPWIGLLDRFGGRSDQAVVRFSIEVARRHAWSLAEQLAAVPTDDWTPLIDQRDRATANLSKTILRPGPFLPVGLFMIRLRESNDVRRVIDTLGSPC